MPLIPDKDRQVIKETLDKDMKAPVKLMFFTQHESGLAIPGQECLFCRETHQLLEEVVSINSLLNLEVYDFVKDADKAREYGVNKIPALIFDGDKKRVRFYGMPSGYEFVTLIEGILDMSKGDSGLEAETKAALKGLERDVHIQVFVTPTCPYCPMAAQLAHKMALESPRITADVVESTGFPQLVQRYRVRAVPKVVINETISFEGALPEKAFLDKVLEAAKKK